MKFIKLALVMAFLVLFALACDSGTNNNQPSGTANGPAASASPSAKAENASPTPEADQFAHGRTVFAQSCALCHGEGGEGQTVDIEGKKLKVPSLISGHALKHSDEEYAKQIANGGEGMPAFKDKLKREEIDQLVGYIRKRLQPVGEIPTAVAPASPRR